jgi:hypothetical protein
MKTARRQGPVQGAMAKDGDGLERAFAGIFGLFLALSLLKFGNPVILDHLIEVPRNWDEWRVFAWPVRFGWLGLAGVSILGASLIVRTGIHFQPKWIACFVIVWIFWQFLAIFWSISPSLSRLVVFHFATCLVSFFLGWWVLGRVTETRVFWLCLILGFLGVLSVACDQRFGGLEATRKMILENPAGGAMSPDYLARIKSNRVFGTLVYPNALAGVILMLLPLSAYQVRQWAQRWGEKTGKVLSGVMVILGLAVLVWSGSKAGWLIAMAMALMTFFHWGLSLRLRVVLSVILLVGGSAAFGVLYAEKLRQGATSVAARSEYWKAAVQGAQKNPWLGLGPGGFKTHYAKVKPADAEMAQLAHNDYLQQATDSGIPGFLAYLAFILGSLGWLYRQRGVADPFERWTWLGVAGWFSQGLVEFGLYIPAAAWCAFTLLGWLLAQRPSPIRSRSLGSP